MVGAEREDGRNNCLERSHYSILFRGISHGCSVRCSKIRSRDRCERESEEKEVRVQNA
jgi:hypothetical protein